MGSGAQMSLDPHLVAILQVEHNLALNVFKLDHNGEPILEAPIKVPHADRATLGRGEVPHIHAQVGGIGIDIALDLFSS